MEQASADDKDAGAGGVLVGDGLDLSFSMAMVPTSFYTRRQGDIDAHQDPAHRRSFPENRPSRPRRIESVNMTRAEFRCERLLRSAAGAPSLEPVVDEP